MDAQFLRDEAAKIRDAQKEKYDLEVKECHQEIKKIVDNYIDNYKEEMIEKA